ncbi:MAG: bifunctional demethylmenaquinone methyltransferase/2-methoxy-6-polyprenyl-1,4-benzoquinol methylase UbiE [Rhodobacteraceae bacterium]|nr:bifunctional demethylmenaquinone methyltransferase/2-methoxy-6-polyprenyl-1,4-benzoquinol methylase UbiE [Paracoccaceae bacterium]
MSESKSAHTHFGYQNVPEENKSGLVKEVFNNVSSKYDVMNDLMSVGIHRVWKNTLINWLAPKENQNLLDVAGGTGDIATRFLNQTKSGNATILDMTESMLQEGTKRITNSSLSSRMRWVVGDAMTLPFKKNTFDIYTISFGIRNITKIDVALSEAFRVLKPGGRIMILEFSKLPNPMMQKAYDLYSFNVIPKIGEIVAGDKDSYQYLVESIRKFPDQVSFANMMTEVGFENVKFRNLTFGVAALHSGWKI